MMNPIKSFFDQQIGKSVWKEYDLRLTRLRCTREDEFQRIMPSLNENDQNADTPIFACKFAQNKGYEHILALANEEGYLAIHDTLGTEPRHANLIHHNAIFDLAWLCDQMKLITVSGDHTARLVDINTDHLCVTQIFTGHTRSIKTVASRYDDPSMFATGSRDGCILIWDTRSNISHDIFSTPDRTIAHSHQSRAANLFQSNKKKNNCSVSGANSVTGLAFQDEYTLISCSAGDGKIKFWDLRKTYKTLKREPLPKHIIEYSGNTTRNGFSNLTLDNDCIRLYANCLDNTIYCYNIANYNPQPVMCYKGHQNSTFFVKSSLSHDGKYIISGSSDQKAYIWNTKNSEPIVRLNGHTEEVTCVAWRPTSETLLVTCSDDVRHKLWRIGSEILPDNWEYEGRGEAEVLNVIPRVTKRTFVHDHKASPNKKLKTCDTCLHYFDKICESCNYNSNNNRKRILVEYKNPPSKIQKCLFKPVTNQNDTTSKTAEELNKNNAKRKRPSIEDLIDIDRLKSMRLESEDESQLEDNSLKENCFNPLTDLPNFVIDGCAPHLTHSPQKKPDKDWLTKIRIQKNLTAKYANILAENDIYSNNFAENQARLSKTPKSRSKRHTCSSPQSPILNFFKVTNSNLKDVSCSTKVSSANYKKETSN